MSFPTCDVTIRETQRNQGTKKPGKSVRGGFPETRAKKPRRNHKKPQRNPKETPPIEQGVTTDPEEL